MESNGEKPGANPDAEGLIFFGRITASVTHELNNVMSIVEQTAGLLEDLCLGEEKGRDIEVEKLREVSFRIINQVDRGVQIIKRLNYFAHSVDEPIQSFDLDVLLSNLVGIAERFANLKQVDLEYEIPYESLTITSRALVVEQVVFQCIRLSITTEESNGKVVVSAKAHEPGIEITIAGPPIPDSEKDDAKIASMYALTALIEGQLEIDSDDSGATFRLLIPNISSEAYHE